MTNEQRKDATLAVAEDWRNGFYIVTGLSPDMRKAIQEAIGKMRK